MLLTPAVSSTVSSSCCELRRLSQLGCDCLTEVNLSLHNIISYAIQNISGIYLRMRISDRFLTFLVTENRTRFLRPTILPDFFNIQFSCLGIYTFLLFCCLPFSPRSHNFTPTKLKRSFCCHLAYSLILKHQNVGHQSNRETRFSLDLFQRCFHMLSGRYSQLPYSTFLITSPYCLTILRSLSRIRLWLSLP